MPLFVQGEAKEKLLLLYFTEASALDITREQLYRAMIENECMSYFDFQTAMHELEEDGFIAAIPRSFGQGYRVTGRGKQSLSLFQESLPFSLRRRLADYAEANREAMRRETQLVTSMEEQPSGGYMVELTAQEQNAVVLRISMLVASRDMAQRVRANWAGASNEIYRVLLDQLLQQTKAPEAEQAAQTDEQKA